MPAFDKAKYPLQTETYKIIGIAMNIHSVLGKGFAEIVYKDAFEYEFKQHNISFEREKEYCVKYKGIVLPTSFMLTLLSMIKLFWK